MFFTSSSSSFLPFFADEYSLKLKNKYYAKFTFESNQILIKSKIPKCSAYKG